MNNVSHNNYQRLVRQLPKAGKVITKSWENDYQRLVIPTSYIGASKKEAKKVLYAQMLYPELAEELMRLAYVTHQYLEKKAGGGLVRTISRTASVWREFQDYQYELSEKFVRKLASKAETKAVEQAAKKAHKFNSNVDASVEVFNLGAKYWMKVYDDLMRESVLSYGDCSFIKGIADYIGRNQLPTTAQCRRLLKVVEKAEDKGYVMP